MTVFGCGHPRVSDNIQGIKNPRCRTCSQMYDKRRRSRGGSRYQDKNHGTYDNIQPAEKEGRDKFTDALPVASDMLLKAIYREHPGVFAQAKKDGRYCVIPGSNW